MQANAWNKKLTLGILFLLSLTELNAIVYRIRKPSLTTQIINAGVSLNQQIVSTSLNSSVSAATNGGQFVINKSGRYFLSTSVSAAPAASRTPCIYINASDVVLDLGGKTLTLSATTNQKNSSAIEIAADKTSITIMNGTINGRAGTSSVYTTTGIKFNANASNILIDSVKVINCGERGIVFDTGCSDIILNQVRACNSSAVSGYAARCLSLSSCNNVTIMDSSFNKTTSTCTNSTYGIFAVLCNNLTFSNIQIFNTTGIAGYIRGLWLVNCTGATCDNVQVHGSTAGSNAAMEVSGIDLLESTGCTFLNCSASNGLATHYTTTTYGFKLTYASSSNTFVNCTASNNRGNGTSSAFRISGSHFNSFTECLALGNGGVSRLAYGFQLGLNSEPSLTVDLAISCSGNSFASCKVNGNRATQGNTYGFDLAGETGSSIQNCEIKGNSAAGICYGIALHGNCIKNVVEHNNIYTNLGTTGMYGFKDFAYDSTTFLRGNVAFGHGATFSGGNAALTDTGAMNYFFQYAEAVGQMNVQLLIKETDIANMNAFDAGSTAWFNFSVLHSSIAG